MEKKAICPYLGLPDDAETSLNFPSEGNYCYHARPIAPIHREHQANYCLTGQHTRCPVFAAKHLSPLPEPVVRPSASPRKVASSLVPLIVLVGYLLIQLPGPSAVLGRWMASFGPGPAVQNELTVPVTGLFGAPPPAVDAPLPTQTNAAAAQEQQPLVADVCAAPGGWAAYIIQPTDTLFRLSILHGVSVEELQKANCLSNQAPLTAGQTFFVPALIAVITPTPTSVPPTVPPVPVNAVAAEPDQPNTEASEPETPATADPPSAPVVANPPSDPDPGVSEPVVQPPPPQDDESNGGNNGDDNDDDDDKDNGGNGNNGGGNDDDDDKDKDKGGNGGGGGNDDDDDDKDKDKGGNGGGGGNDDDDKDKNKGGNGGGGGNDDDKDKNKGGNGGGGGNDDDDDDKDKDKGGGGGNGGGGNGDGNGNGKGKGK